MFQNSGHASPFDFAQDEAQHDSGYQCFVILGEAEIVTKHGFRISHPLGSDLLYIILYNSNSRY
jgi:hypothetical protein